MPVSLLSRGSAVLGSLAIGTAALALPMLTVSPAQAAPGDFDPITHSASIGIESFPTTTTLELARFDDVDETYLLQEVTVTATVHGEVDGALTNLSETQDKNLTATVDAAISVDGTGVTDLDAHADKSESFTLAPGASTDYLIADDDSVTTTLSDPAVVAGFVGEGNVDYEVWSLVETTVTGPAPYLSTGVAVGSATVEVSYTYDLACDGNPTVPMDDPTCEGPPPEPCEWDPSIPADDPDCDPPVDPCEYDPSIPSDDPGCFEPCEYDPTIPMDDPDCVPPVEPCPYNPSIPMDDPACDPPPCVTFKIEPVRKGTYGLPGAGGSFNVTRIYTQGGPVFDWTSTRGVEWIKVKGGRGFKLYDYDPARTSGTALHAPKNKRNGKWYGLSHLVICAQPPSEPPAAVACDTWTSLGYDVRNPAWGMTTRNPTKVFDLDGGGKLTVRVTDWGYFNGTKYIKRLDWSSDVLVGEVKVKEYFTSTWSSYKYAPMTKSGAGLTAPYGTYRKAADLKVCSVEA